MTSGSGKTKWLACLAGLLPVMAVALTATPALAQFSQDGPKHVGSGAVGAAVRGQAVAISADGQTAVYGGPNDNSGVGAAWIAARTGGSSVWSQQGSKLVGTGAVGSAQQGTSVAMSGDGNTVLVGGVADDGNKGAMWVFTKIAGVWVQEGPKLVGSDAVGNAGQGLSVALSADGNTAIVGGSSDNSQVGAGWIWTRTAGVWTQQGPKLAAVGGRFQGWSVSLSIDGNTALVGGSVGQGLPKTAAWVWVRTGGGWTQQGSQLVGSDAVGNAQIGTSVSLSADGNTAMVGTYADNGGVGGAWVWGRSAGTWTQQGSKLIANDTTGTSQQGVSVSLSADGNSAVIGGAYDNGFIGGAWVWARSAGIWSQRGPKVVGSNAVGSALQGISVSMAADGNAFVLGGYLDSSGAGAVWFFIRSPFAQGAVKLVGSGAVGAAQQGSGVALSADGTTAIVGGSSDNGNIGAAWVWVRSGSAWSQQGQKLVGTSSGGTAGQGYSVALSADGNTAIVGAYMYGGTFGAAWVWTRTGGVWTQQGPPLVGTGAVGNAEQGISVALSADGNTAAVGGPGDNSAAGAVWVWTRTGAAWTQQGAKLVGNGAVGNARQGGAVALSADGNTVIFGGYLDNSAAGAVWVWTRTAGVWSQQGGKLVGSNASGVAGQGYSVSLSSDGNSAVVGGPLDGPGFNDFGAMWVWTRSAGAWSEEGTKRVGSDAIGGGGSLQGLAVSVSGDGNTALVGGWLDNSGVGATWVWVRNSGVWTQRGSKLIGAGAIGLARQGFGAALSRDGNYAVIGGSYDNSGAGAAWVFSTPAAAATPPTLRFAATKNGAAGAITSVTAPQSVALTFTGGAPWWSVSVNQPWVQLSVTSGTGAGLFTVSISDPGNTLGAATIASATITVTAPGTRNTPKTIAVDLTIDQTNGANLGPSFGQVDTPVQNASGVQGAIGVTGWALDDIGVSSVQIFRNCLPSEPQANCQVVLGNNVVYIGDAAFLAEARPDVEAAFPTYPQATRAGWGYLLLTPMLPHVSNSQPYGGQGPLTLYAVATDVEGNQTLLGRSSDPQSPDFVTPTSISMSNDSIAKPFGAIDTPAQGETIAGIFNNFGWALTPDSNTTSGDPGDILIPVNGSTMTVFIDSLPVALVAYNQCRGNVGNPVPGGVFCNDDVANIFGNPTPQPVLTTRTNNPTLFRNLDMASAAIGAYTFDTSTLGNGMHTIAWSVSDSAARNEGIGSRFFNVLNAGSAQPLITLQATQTRSEAATLDHAVPVTERVWGRTGFDLTTAWKTMHAKQDGTFAVRLPEMGRLELWLGTPVDTGYLVANGTLRPLPIGSSLSESRFGWMPPPGYVGPYQLVFVRGHERITVTVTVLPAPRVIDGEAQIRMSLEPVQIRKADGKRGEGLAPSGNSVRVEGWAFDPHAATGSGIGAVHVWATRMDDGVKGAGKPGRPGASSPSFLGIATLDQARPELARRLRDAPSHPGFTLTASLGPGTYTLTAYVWNERTARWEDARSLEITVR